MHRVTLYTRPGCHLCDDTRSLLDRLRDEFALEVTEQDITRSPELYARFNETIPAVSLEDGTVLAPALSEFRLRRALQGLQGERTPGTAVAPS